MEMLWESIKAPLRQGLLFLYALLLNKLFDFILTKVGFSFTEEQKEQLLSWGTPIVYAVLSFIDKFMHEKGKEIEEHSKKILRSVYTLGIARF